MAQDTALNDIHWPEEISLRWALRSDIPEITQVLHENLLSFEFFDHFCPDRKLHRDEFYAFVLARVRMFFVMPGVRFMVAEKLKIGLRGNECTIIGFSTWDAQGDDNPIAVEWKRQDSSWWRSVERTLVDMELLHHRYFRNTMFNYDVFNRLRGLLHDSFADESLRSNLHLQYLMIDPRAQGTGVGHRLLQWGLDVSEQTGLPVILESSLAGHPFYLKHGFKVLKEVRIDAHPDKTKAYQMPMMVYDPRNKEHCER